MIYYATSQRFDLPCTSETQTSMCPRMGRRCRQRIRRDDARYGTFELPKDSGTKEVVRCTIDTSANDGAVLRLTA